MYPTTKFRNYNRPVSAFNLLFDENPVRDFFNTQSKAIASVPSANVKESKDQFKIELAAPGMEKSDFQINLDENTLSISAEHTETMEENEKFTRKEYNFFKFKRSFSIPETVNTEGISANYEKGILTVTLPKKEEETRESKRKIEVA